MRATPFFFLSNRRHSSSIHLLFTPSSFHHAMDDMPSDGAVAVGPHHSDGMGNELKMSCSGRRQSGRNEEKRRNKEGGGEKCRQGRCERRTRWRLHTFSWSVFTPQPCCLHWLPLFCPLFHILHAFKMLNGQNGCSLYPTTQKMLKIWKGKITSDFFSSSFV